MLGKKMHTKKSYYYENTMKKSPVKRNKDFIGKKIKKKFINNKFGWKKNKFTWSSKGLVVKKQKEKLLVPVASFTIKKLDVKNLNDHVATKKSCKQLKSCCKR